MRFTNRAQARSAIFEFVEVFYNLKGTDPPIRLATCIFPTTNDETPGRAASAGRPLPHRRGVPSKKEP